MTRIFVVGPTGSGKSTLALRLAGRFGVPVYPLDEMHWIRSQSGDERRDPENRAALLKHAVDQPSWIIEGVQFKWAGLAMEQAQRIIVLDLPRRIVLFRLLRRFLARRFRGPRGTFRALKEEWRWSHDWFSDERRMLLERLAPMKTKVIMQRR